MLPSGMRRFFTPEDPSRYLVQQQSYEVERRLIAGGVSAVIAGKYTNGVFIGTDKPAPIDSLPADMIATYKDLLDSFNEYHEGFQQRIAR